MWQDSCQWACSCLFERNGSSLGSWVDFRITLSGVDDSLIWRGVLEVGNAGSEAQDVAKTSGEGPPLAHGVNLDASAM